jgi:methionyl-tRNA formyltransferase
MIATLAGLKSGNVKPCPQDESQATLAPLLRREDGLIDFSRSAAEAWNRLRGFQPWPGVFTLFRKKTLHLHAAEPAIPASAIMPGHFSVNGEHLSLGFAHETALEVRELQIEGKKRVSAADFINGYHPRSDEVLGEADESE